MNAVETTYERNMAIFNAMIAAAKPAAAKPLTVESLAAVYYGKASIARLCAATPELPELIARMELDEMRGERSWIFCGRTGCGKTARAAVISHETGIKMEKAQRLAERIAAGEAVEKVAYTGGEFSTWGKRDQMHDLIIDDLGCEPQEINLYGNKVNPLAAVLDYRLEKYPKIRTYITTNLMPDEIRGRYGDRIYSRIAQQCYVVGFAAFDHRMNPGYLQAPQTGLLG